MVGPPIDPIFQCDICKQICVNSLRRHRRTMHAEEYYATKRRRLEEHKVEKVIEESENNEAPLRNQIDIPILAPPLPLVLLRAKEMTLVPREDAAVADEPQQPMTMTMTMSPGQEVCRSVLRERSPSKAKSKEEGPRSPTPQASPTPTPTLLLSPQDSSSREGVVMSLPPRSLTRRRRSLSMDSNATDEVVFIIPEERYDYGYEKNDSWQDPKDVEEIRKQKMKQMEEMQRENIKRLMGPEELLLIEKYEESALPLPIPLYGCKEHMAIGSIAAELEQQKCGFLQRLDLDPTGSSHPLSLLAIKAAPAPAPKMKRLKKKLRIKRCPVTSCSLYFSRKKRFLLHLNEHISLVEEQIYKRQTLRASALRFKIERKIAEESDS